MNITPAILETREVNFDTNFQLTTSNALEETPKTTQLQSSNENSYETIDGDFDDKINPTEFQLTSSDDEPCILIASNPENKDLKKLLSFVQGNKEAILSKLSNTEPKQNTEVVPEQNNDPVITEKYNINKEIEASSQGEIGDCWLLAGLNSLSFSKDGQALIKEAITNNHDGTYKVRFKGVGVTCKVTTEDLDKARASGKYSTGDDDVLLFEIAVEKFLKALQNGTVDKNKFPKNAPEFLYDETGNPLNGGFPKDILYLLTGKNADYKLTKSKGFNLEQFYNNIENNPNGSAACLHIKPDNEYGLDTLAKDVNGNVVVLTKENDNHGWSIKSVDGNVVTMVNPWNSDKEVAISKQELEDSILGYEYLAV